MCKFSLKYFMILQFVHGVYFDDTLVMMSHDDALVMILFHPPSLCSGIETHGLEILCCHI